jgi:4-amino-4-deoxy-L-arabinose transferase-like glycosyltransferase
MSKPEREPLNRPRTPPETRLYIMMLAITLLVRVMAVIGTDPTSVYIQFSRAAGAPPPSPGEMVGDPALYDRFGWNLATEGVLGVGSRPTGFCLPGYPLLLAGTYKLAGHLPGVVRWLQVLLNTLTVLFLGALARQLGGPRAEILAVLFGGMSPFFVYFVREIFTEVLFLFGFCAALLTAAWVGRRGRIADGVLYGMAVSVLIMTRPVGFFLVPGTLILARPWASERRRRRLGGLLLGGLVIAGSWGAWILRNRQVFGETVLLDTHGGFSFYLGQLQMRGVPVEEAVKKIGFQDTDIYNGTLPGGPHGELEASRRAGDDAMKMIRSDLPAFAATAFRNLKALWLGSSFTDVAGRGGMRVLMILVAWLSYGPVLVLGLVGLVQCWRTGRWDFFWAFLVILSTTTLLHAVVMGGKRYRAATIDPELMVLAGWQGSRLLGRWWREPQRLAS